MTLMLTLTLEAEADLLMRDRQRLSNVLRSDPYIRGSVLRGAIADAWIASLGVDEEGAFRSIFAGDLEFRGGYPLVPLREPDADVATMIVPRSVFRSKIDGRYVDTALGSERPRGFARVGGLVALQDSEDSGSSAWIVQEDVRYRRQRIGTKQDGSGLADVDEGKLFTEVVIASGTRFEVMIVGHEQRLEELLVFFARDDIEQRITIGRSRTILGMTVIVGHRIGDAPARVPFKGDSHAILFETDTILLDGHLQPVLPSAQWLGGLAGGGVDAIRDVDISAVAQVAVAGWSAVHRGPKPIEVAVERGSVMTFRCNDAEVLNALAERLRRAVGWRRTEGFGVATLDHPIHRAQWLPGASHASTSPVRDEDERAMAQDISATAHQLAQQLNELGIGYSMWSGFRNNSEEERPQRAGSRDVQARSGRSSGAGSRSEDRRHALLNAYRSQVAQTGWSEAVVEEFKAAVARELLLLERGDT